MSTSIEERNGMRQEMSETRNTFAVHTVSVHACNSQQRLFVQLGKSCGQAEQGASPVR